MTVNFERKSELIERRRQGRAQIGLTVALRERGRSAMDARLVDFSALGCRVDGAILGRDTAQVWVKLPGLESLAAERVWSEGHTAGILFDAPLHPAVAARFLPVPGSHAAAAVENPFEMTDPLLSRREQIVAGISGSDNSPLQRRKRPTGLGLTGRISRAVTRSADTRAECRYADAVPEGTALAIGGENVRVLNVSPSGIKIGRAPIQAEIGDKIELAFEGFPAMTGQLVWMGGGEAGIALPEASIELFDRTAG